jgi:hypothetical protein
LEAETGVKPRCPKGRAPARGLDARLCLQHTFMRAGDASPKAQSKNSLDSDHGIYRDHRWRGGFAMHSLRGIPELWAKLGRRRRPLNVVHGNSPSNCNRFGASSATKLELPVTFAPGRLRLATRPNATGSPPVVKTMGMVVVAAFAASAAVVLAATITATRRRTRSAASAGSLSI